MPEIAEVRLTAEELEPYLTGGVVESYEVLNPKFEPTGTDLELPAKIREVTSYGKRILIRFKRQTLVIGLGMTGMFNIDIKKTKHTRVVFKLKDGTKLYYTDIRGTGSSMVVIDGKYEPEGIDVLRGRMPRRELRRILNKHQRANFATLLLNRQDYFPGIGNYLRCEILYAAGISPDDKCSEIELKPLHKALHKIPRLAYEGGGLTISTFYTPSGKTGLYQCMVYSKDRCPKDHKVTKIQKSGRPIYYCKKCQM